jgi:uncharacterized protein YndB with AHSA1/START domain
MVPLSDGQARRELVWKAWTDPKQLAQWCGPHGFTDPVCKVDVRAGGAILIPMRAQRSGLSHGGVLQEILAPERLVFLSSAWNEKGNRLFEVLNSVTFAERGEKTTLTMHARIVQSTPAAAPHLAGMEGAWTQNLERLAAFVARA